MEDQNNSSYKETIKILQPISQKAKHIENKSIWIMRAEENSEYELLNKIQSKYNRFDNEFNVNKSRNAFSQDSNLREISSADIGTPKKYLWMPKSRAYNFGFMRPSTSLANKRINIELPNYKEKLSPKNANFFFKEDCQQNIRLFPKRSEFLKLRKAKERISKKKMKWRLLERNNNNNQIELDYGSNISLKMSRWKLILIY
ncbi:unnamed protein product [Blepharisma stoltei]|uniref:Protein TIC 214 n=1 Tax=Blepharisma stoltei TaxID=1481888 RepID=A0AAU9J5T0_9CILI|nr:unnamed protein product [Blepharisma stoltei]